MNLPARRRTVALAAALAAGLLILLTVVRYARKHISQAHIQERVVATIQSEARASFLVTGTLDITATTTIENTKTFLPGLLNVDLGTSRATVQVPGRAYYGFDVRKLDAKRIKLHGDTVDITVPQPELLSVDANLQELRVWSQQGWLRTPASVDAVERMATRRLDNALSHQAATHVANSAQPRVNTAQALEKMLAPPLIAAGIKRPVFHFRIGDHLFMDR